MSEDESRHYDNADSWCKEAVSSGSEFMFDQHLFRRTLKEASVELCFKPEALQSFFRNTHLVHVKRTAHKIRTSTDQLVAAYAKGNSIVSIAKEWNYPPSLVARMILEKVTVTNKKMITNVMKNPEGISSHDIAPRYKETEKLVSIDIPNIQGNLTRMAREVMNAIDHDPMYGPEHDRERNVIGAEYELLLEENLRKLDLPFETENELRERGTSRTPDILLSCPVGIQVKKKNGSGVEWKVVCWIDSKALFGDANTHHVSVLPQAETYVHRFGPGLVLYWFGHAPLSRLDDSHGDVAIVGWKLPDTIMLPTGELITQD